MNQENFSQNKQLKTGRIKNLKKKYRKDKEIFRHAKQ